MSVLAFQQRAARVLAFDDPQTLEALDALITDGCAEALDVETEIGRIRRRREAALGELDGPGEARSVVEMGERMAVLDERLGAVREAVTALMHRRSRRRLGEFLAER